MKKKNEKPKKKQLLKKRQNLWKKEKLKISRYQKKFPLNHKNLKKTQDIIKE